MVSIPRVLIACGLMVITFFVLRYVSYSEDIKPNKPFSTFPLTIGNWEGVKEEIDKDIFDVLGVDDYIMSSYSSTDGKQVHLYIGFYQSQRQGDLIHSPKHCMPGAGWKIMNTSLEEIEMPGYKNGKAEIIKLSLKKGNERQVVLYWFQSRGRIIHSEYSQKVYLVVDAITKHRTDGSFVRLISPVADNDEEKCVETMKTFIGEVIPYLFEYIPS